MILNSWEFLSVLYVVFFTRSSGHSFLSSSFVSIDWRVLSSAFYILLVTIRLAFGILFSASFSFASKMVYSIKSLVSNSCFFIKLLAFVFFILNFLLFIGKVSVSLLNCLCLGFYFPLFEFYYVFFNYAVLKNITKFLKILWSCFKCVTSFLTNF